MLLSFIRIFFLKANPEKLPNDTFLYNYHGECDLIMTRSYSFDNGLGLEVHSRTKLVNGVWSLITNTAIQIGSDIFEVNNNGEAYLNHKEITTFPIEMADKFTVIKEIDLSTSTSIENEMIVEYTIDLNERSDSPPYTPELQNQIIITFYQSMITVKVNAPLQDAVGMLENHITYGLDGHDDHNNVYMNPNDMNNAWQVTDKDPLLFNDIGSVLYSEKCIVLKESVESQSRKLRSVTIQEKMERS